MGIVYDIFISATLGILALTAIVVVYRSLTGRGGEIGGLQLRGAAARIRAVARVTFAEGIRARVAVVFIGLHVVTLPVLCLAARGDGTIKGQVQMFLGYSLGLTAFYLSLLTVFFAARTLSTEIASHQIYLLAAKPLPRWQLLAGKWVGITALNVLLVLFACGVTYGGARWLVYRFQRTLARELVQRGGLSADQADDCVAAISGVRGPGGKGADSPVVPAVARALGWTNDQVIALFRRLPEALRLNLRRLDELRRQVFVARAAVRPEPPDLTPEIDKEYAARLKAGTLPQGPAWPVKTIRKEIETQLLAPYSNVSYLEARGWRLKGPAPRGDDEQFLLSVRYKVHCAAYSPEVALPDGTHLPENTFLAQWIVGDQTKSSVFVWPSEPQPAPVDAFQEIEVPNRVVEPDGTIQLIMRNMDPRGLIAIIGFNEGLEVLYRVGSFEQNVAMAGLALLIPLGFLAAFGLLMSTFCSFQVAALVCLVMLGVSASGGILKDALEISNWNQPDALSTHDEIRLAVTDAVLSAAWLGDVDPSERLLDGRAITWGDLGALAGRVLGIRGGVVMLVAILVFRRRELAAVTV
ncbi:MAG: ABC transporter permease [Phycisphaerae bacterium]